MWSSLKLFKRTGAGRVGRSASSAAVRRNSLRRVLRAERLEPRRLMAADPIHVGIVYIETDFLEGESGQGMDEIPDRFLVSFNGGAPGTQMTEFRVSLDKDQNGLAVGDLLFDTAPGGRGKAGWHPFKVAHIDSISGKKVAVEAEVEDGSSELLVRLNNFMAGDLLEFTIDVDEVLRNHADLDRFNAALDTIASGQEMQDSLFWADFVAPHYEPVTAHSLFVADFGDPQAEFGLRLPPNEGPPPDSFPSRTAAAIATTVQTPKPISVSGIVWVDDNLNLQRDPGEPVLPGVLVALFRKDPATGQFVDTGHVQVTDAAGAYRFGTDLGLMPGEYQVVQTQPENYFSVGAVVGRVDGTAVGRAATSDILTGINIPLGDLHAVDYNFAEARPAAVGGFVYRDDNDNGRRDAGEPGIGGVTMRLVPRNTLAPITAQQTITAADGSYQFVNLPPGQYDVIQVTQPAGLDDGRDSPGTVDGRTSGVADDPGDAIRGIQLQGNSRGINYNFGELPRGIITGGVYLAAPGEDCGGRDRPGSTPLAGVEIELLGPGGVTVMRTTTGADGQYRFEDVSKGIYSIIEVTPQGLFDGKAHVGMIGGVTVGVAVGGGLIRDIVLPAGGTGVNYDFCEAAPGKLSGYVYHDQNQNGRRDAGEEPIPQTKIELVDASGTVVAVTQTNAQGYYEFVDLPPGQYSIRQTQPAGYIDGLDSAGTIDGVTVGVAVNPGDLIRDINLRQGQTGINYNFGELLPATLSGRVHVDDNGNCTYDPGELLLSGVTIRLLDSSGSEVARTTTGEDGRYTFHSIVPGTYTVVQEQPAGYFPGTARPGSAGGQRISPNRIGNITLGSAQVAVDYDFCEKPPAEISGFVYVDNNQNARRDPGEPAIAGVRIDLIDSAGNQVATTTTDGSGFYRFSHLPAGTYTLRQTQPDGFLQGSQQAGSHGGDASIDDVISQIPVDFGNELTQYNFGELLPASLSGRVHVDDNGNCTYDPGERLLAGVTIRLLDSAGREVARTTTNDQGRYTFTSIEPGTYTVVQTQPTEYFPGTARPGTAGGVKESPNRIGNITLGSGEVAVDYDFCEKPPAEISGYVYVDQNDNDRRDPGERPIPGTRVDLYDEAGTLVASAVTDANGFYRFTFLPAGRYTLRQTQPAGYFQGGQQAGSHGGDASVDDVISRIPIDFGADLVEYNFGELEPASISGTVFLDHNQNRNRDPGEPPLAGVTVQLLDARGQVVAAAQTDAEGGYLFTGLKPGIYSVRQLQPVGYFHGGQTAGNFGGDDSVDDLIAAISLPSGGRGIDYDFPELAPASLSGSVYLDNNLNRRRDPGEAPLAGVSIQLLDAGGHLIATAQTDPDGQYRFSGLRPGTYSVRQLQPDGYFHGGQVAGNFGGNAGVDDAITGISLPSGARGVDYDFPEVAPARLSGYVFQDGAPLPLGIAPPPESLRNYRDGIRRPDSEPIAGVTVQLRNILGQPIAGDRALPGIYDGVIEVVTDADGYFEFIGLRPGSYHVYQVQPEGFIDGLDTPGTTGGIAVNAADRISDTQTLATLNLLTASPETHPQYDAILNVMLGPGVHSQENNFSEILVDMPVLPLPPPPPQSLQVLAPLPDLFPPINKAVSFGLVQDLRPMMIADVDYPVTWHLSIINGGFPRGNGIEPGTKVVSIGTFDDAFVPGAKRAGRWILVDRQGNRVEAGEAFTLGGDESLPLVGDFNGDGIDQIAVFSRGQWFIDFNGNGVWDEGDLWLRLGTEMDRPVVGDWDGDGKADVAIFGREWQRDPEAIVEDPGLPSPANTRRREFKRTGATRQIELEQERLLQKGSSGDLRTDAIDHVFRYGEHADIPLAGDWSGSGIDSIAVYRGGRWTLDTDGDGRLTDRDEQAIFGGPGDIPVVGDWNGDGISNLGVVRGDVWIIDSNGDRQLTDEDARIRIPKPSPDAKPIVGDWDGDGVDEFGWYDEAG